MILEVLQEFDLLFAAIKERFLLLLKCSVFNRHQLEPF